MDCMSVASCDYPSVIGGELASVVSSRRDAAEDAQELGVDVAGGAMSVGASICCNSRTSSAVELKHINVPTDPIPPLMPIGNISR